MTTATMTTDSDRYAKCIKASKQVRWDIDEDVFRGREFEHREQVPPGRPGDAHGFRGPL